jgi:hypothetical protein
MHEDHVAAPRRRPAGRRRRRARPPRSIRSVVVEQATRALPNLCPANTPANAPPCDTSVTRDDQRAAPAPSSSAAPSTESTAAQVRSWRRTRREPRPRTTTPAPALISEDDKRSTLVPSPEADNTLRGAGSGALDAEGGRTGRVTSPAFRPEVLRSALLRTCSHCPRRTRLVVKRPPLGRKARKARGPSVFGCLPPPTSSRRESPHP